MGQPFPALNVQAGFTCSLNTAYRAANPTSRWHGKGSRSSERDFTITAALSPMPFHPTCPYLLEHFFGSIEFHLVPFQTHFQVPNLFSLGFHLVCEDTHLLQEIK